MFHKLLVCWASAVTPRVTLNYSVTETLPSLVRGSVGCSSENSHFYLPDIWSPTKSRKKETVGEHKFGTLSFIYPIPVSSLPVRYMGSRELVVEFIAL